MLALMCVQVLVAQSKLAEAAAAIQDTSDIAGTAAAEATVAALYKAAGNETAAVSTLQSALEVLVLLNSTALICLLASLVLCAHRIGFLYLLCAQALKL
jgi:hypothetical protein